MPLIIGNPGSHPDFLLLNLVLILCYLSPGYQVVFLSPCRVSIPYLHGTSLVKTFPGTKLHSDLCSSELTDFHMYGNYGFHLPSSHLSICSANSNWIHDCCWALDIRMGHCVYLEGSYNLQSVLNCYSFLWVYLMVY